jgi:hypothetical protein
MPAPCNGNDKQFDYTFLIICRYLKLVKNQKIILLQTENSQVVTTLKCTEYEKIICYFHLNYEVFYCSRLKGK